MEEDEPPCLKTIVTEEDARSVITRNSLAGSAVFAVAQSLPGLREHGCIYCFARPSHSYLGLSPGLDFESRLVAKRNAPEVLLRELAKPSYEPDTITVGINTDAYQPIERERQLTRRILQILHDCENPVALITKSSLIERDIDLLAPMAAKGQAIARDDHHAGCGHRAHAGAAGGQPGAAAAGDPHAGRGRHSGERIDCTGDPLRHRTGPGTRHGSGRRGRGAPGGYIVLRLPWEVSPLFRQWLQAHFPTVRRG
jgi:hypothetical protein